MKSSGRFGSKAGVTFLELMVVVLIIMILAIVLLPLFGPIITHVKYAVSAVPAAGDMRTKVELYRVKNAHLPGVMHTPSGSVVEMVPDAMAAASSGKGGTSHLGDSATTDCMFTQGFAVFERGDATSGDVVNVYSNAMVSVLDLSAGVTTNFTMVPVADIGANAVANHFGQHLDVSWRDFSGNFLNPNHVFYWTVSAGYNSGIYAYAVGVFGDGNRLPGGTGYAILEIVNPRVEQRTLLTWERWAPEDTEAGQIAFYSQDETTILGSTSGAIAPEVAKEANICWLPTAVQITQENLTTEDPYEEYADMLTNLRTAGWE